MQASQIPSKFAIPFANSAGVGYIRTIPQASQIGVTNGAASLTDGFPPLTFLPVGAGGTPPWGQDFNGILKQITQWNQWQSAGGLAVYDSGFSASIGGYPQGAILASATATGVIWMSTADNNTTNPDGVSPANWVLITPKATSLTSYAAAGTYTFTVPANTYQINCTCVGGGGGAGGMGVGGNGVVYPAGGGAAGGTSSGWISVTPGQTITIIVGAAGTGGAASSSSSAGSYGTNGGTGGTSSIGAFMSAPGGSGGGATTAGTFGGTGGLGIGGQINQAGGNGTDGSGGIGVAYYGGNGGSSSQGGGGRSALAFSTSVQNGRAPGSGGGSVYNATWASNAAGGSGAAGTVILQY